MFVVATMRPINTTSAADKKTDLQGGKFTDIGMEAGPIDELHGFHSGRSMAASIESADDAEREPLHGTRSGLHVGGSLAWI